MTKNCDSEKSCPCSTCDKKLTCDRSKYLGGRFQDRGVFDSKTKTIISVRDGFMDYLGEEIGREPVDQIFRVYRSPETIHALAELMNGLPLKYDHIETNPDIGKIETTEVIELAEDQRTNGATVALQHSAQAEQEVFDLLASGVREVSLDYIGKMIHNEDSIEQTDLQPDFLAIVENGRCGDICRIQDKRTPEGKQMTKLDKLLLKFKDAGSPELTMASIVEVIAALPEAVKNAPVESLKKVMPALIEIVEIAREKGVEVPELEQEEEQAEETPAGDEEPDDDKKEIEDGEPDEDEAKLEDEEPDDDEKEKFADGKILFNRAQLKDAAAAAVAAHLATVEHARNFLPSDYSFEGKTEKQIMADVFTAEGHDQRFTDAEMPLAFKLLKPKGAEYLTFGDSQPDQVLADLADKEI